MRSILVAFVLLNIMAAFHAYKLTHNYDGAGQKHKGPDRMNIFEKSKALIFGVKNYKSPITRFPEEVYETVLLETSNKLKIECWWIPRENAKATIILFHGHMGSKSSLIDQSAYFQSLNFSTLLVDFRAHGNSGGSACTIGKKEAEEVKLAMDFLRSIGEKDIVLWGTSMGAAAITSAFDQYEIEPSAVILEMPFGSLHNAVKGRVMMMGLPSEPISSLLTFWGGVQHGFWAFEFSPCSYARKIKYPILIQWGQLDKRVSDQEIQCIFSNLSSKEKKLVVYPLAGHETLQENDSTKWRSEIKEFLEEKVGY